MLIIKICCCDHQKHCDFSLHYCTKVPADLNTSVSGTDSADAEYAGFAAAFVGGGEVDNRKERRLQPLRDC